jgi:hypothetical protein
MPPTTTTSLNGLFPRGSPFASWLEYPRNCFVNCVFWPTMSWFGAGASPPGEGGRHAAQLDLADAAHHVRGGRKRIALHVVALVRQPVPASAERVVAAPAKK